MTFKSWFFVLAIPILLVSCSSESNEKEEELKIDQSEDIWEDITGDICKDNPHLRDSAACNP